MNSSLSRVSKPSSEEKTSAVLVKNPWTKSAQESQSMVGALLSSHLSQESEVNSLLDSIHQAVSRKRSDLFKQEDGKAIPKHYVNLQSHQVTLEAKDGKVDTDSPYNKMVALCETTFQGYYSGLFSYSENPFVSEASRKEAEKFVLYSGQIRIGNIISHRDISESKELVHFMNKFSICRFYKAHFGIGNLLFPDEAGKEISVRLGQKPKKKGESRKHLDITFKRKLLRYTEKWFTSKNIDYAHSLVHILEKIVDKSVVTIKDIFEKVINSSKDFRPKAKDFELCGIYPSYSIKKYRDLFSPLEWGKIEENKMVQREDNLNKLRKVPEDLHGLYTLFQNISDWKNVDIEVNLFEKDIFLIRDQRLALCSKWKTESKKTPVDMWKMVGRDFLSSSKVRDAFAPGRISIRLARASISYQEVLGLIKYSSEDSLYVADDKIGDYGTQVKSAVSEFLSLVNR